MTKFLSAKLLASLALTLIASLAFAEHHGSKHEKNIVETADVAGQLSTLLAAAKSADLVATLEGEGPYTVFAPTDAAFEKLPEGTVAKLLMPENKDQLVSLLTYHVVPGEVTASEVVKLESATSVQGQMLKIDASDKGVMIDDAKVVNADILASNGVIHVIDTVMMPNI